MTFVTMEMTQLSFITAFTAVLPSFASGYPKADDVRDYMDYIPTIPSLIAITEPLAYEGCTALII